MSTKKDILFFGIHRPNRSPSQRYRIEQFLPFLASKGITYDYEFLLNENRDQLFYASGNLLGKAYIVIYSILKMLQITFFQAKNYKVVFVQRETFMLGTAFFEKQIAKRAKLVFDFDDSIWMQNVSQANQKWAFLKNAEKTKEIIEAAQLNIVGNDYLANYAKQFNHKVVLVPTCIDTEEYKRSSSYSEKKEGKICIGWSGSQTTIEHFKLALPLLKKIKNKFGNQVYFKVIGATKFDSKDLEIKRVAWKRETEIQELEELDIGIMPLPNDEWSKGKCALKGLVYMAMELPAVLQNVGVNSSIVQHGENGLLAKNESQWISNLSELIENKALRIQLGQAGRKTILEKYSIKSNQELFFNSIQA